MADGLRSTERFTGRAAAYARHRPSYPPEAIDAVLDGLGDPSGAVVADVGAGTGISARLFADRGATVFAIEPNAAMRQAAAPHPRVTWHDGAADRTGLGGKSADVAVACQAFHWFATPEAMRELARIARRRIAVVQYERDERDPFTRAYGEIVRRYATDDTETLRAAAIGAFERNAPGRVWRCEFPARQSLTIEGVLGRAASASYVPHDGPAHQALERDLRDAYARHERDGAVALAMVTYVLGADLDAGTERQ
ncbi:MAG: class I SAM-dependent methyltransferase [Candidatus Tumulicola sp.]